MHRWLERRAVTGAVVVVLLALTACTGQGRRQPSFRDSLTACSNVLPAARCGYVWVPADWDHPDGEQRALRIAILPAQAARPTEDPLFYLAGYGSSALGDAAWVARTFAALNTDRALVLVDQRGTGASGAQSCAWPRGEPNTPDAVAPVLRSCLDAASRDPRHDSTPAAVRDLDRVRAMLGYGRVNLYGGSYGVSMGLAYLQRYGARVRSAVFDSGSLLDVPLWQLVPAHAQRSFDELARRCAAEPGCARSYRPAADLAAIVARLTAHPVRVVLGPGQTATIDLVGFLNGVIDDYLGSVETAVLLPADLHALARGRWLDVLRKRGFAARPASGVPARSMQQMTVACGDAWAAMDPAPLREQTGSLFTPASVAKAAQQRAICANWPHDPGASGPVRATAPVVFLNGSADPADPPANVAAASATMPRALAVTVPGGRHGVVTLGCLLDETTAFIRAGQAPEPDRWAACARTAATALPPFPDGA